MCIWNRRWKRLYNTCMLAIIQILRLLQGFISDSWNNLLLQVSVVRYFEVFRRYSRCYDGATLHGAQPEWHQIINTLRPRQNGHHFADDTFNRIFVNEDVKISIKFSLKFVPKGPINNIPALVQIMAWRRSGDKPLSEPMMVSLLTHICVTRPRWVNSVSGISTHCALHI